MQKEELQHMFISVGFCKYFFTRRKGEIVDRADFDIRTLFRPDLKVRFCPTWELVIRNNGKPHCTLTPMSQAKIIF